MLLRHLLQGRVVRASLPAYRLEKGVLEGFLKERFGPYDFNVEVYPSIMFLLSLLGITMYHFSSKTIDTDLISQLL